MSRGFHGGGFSSTAHYDALEQQNPVFSANMAVVVLGCPRPRFFKDFLKKLTKFSSKINFRSFVNYSAKEHFSVGANFTKSWKFYKISINMVRWFFYFRTRFWSKINFQSFVYDSDPTPQKAFFCRSKSYKNRTP